MLGLLRHRHAVERAQDDRHQVARLGGDRRADVALGRHPAERRAPRRSGVEVRRGRSGRGRRTRAARGARGRAPRGSSRSHSATARSGFRTCTPGPVCVLLRARLEVVLGALAQVPVAGDRHHAEVRVERQVAGRPGRRRRSGRGRASARPGQQRSSSARPRPAALLRRARPSARSAAPCRRCATLRA